MDAPAVDDPIPLSHRLRVVAAIDGTSIRLSRADCLTLAKMAEWHEDGRGFVQLAAVKLAYLEHERRADRWIGIACALSVACAIHSMLVGPVAALAAWMLQ